MSKYEDDPTNLVGWFKKNYPSEFDLQKEIGMRANKIYRAVPAVVDKEKRDDFHGRSKEP